jgi:hypothetical protein
MADALGLTRKRIEELYAPQLRMLGIARGTWATDERGVRTWVAEDTSVFLDQLAKLCNNHRWSPKSIATVFNPFTVHRVMATGELISHWTTPGEVAIRASASVLPQTLFRLARKQNAVLEMASLALYSTLQVGDNFSLDTQLAVLLSAGVLSVTLAPPNPTKDSIYVKVANEDARAIVTALLEAAGRNAFSVPSITADLVAETVEARSYFALFQGLDKDDVFRKHLDRFAVTAHLSDRALNALRDYFCVSLTVSMALVCATRECRVTYASEVCAPQLSAESLARRRLSALRSDIEEDKSETENVPGR